MAEQFVYINENRFADRAKAGEQTPNPYRNLAFLSLRQVEQVLLDGFCPDELTINFQQKYRRPA